ncbi:predicted protein [Sclerotinia sclerotiorum 1980 UF-70]|uniref:Uncharacterized protein n=1 Tax=Sclerotinia sclerotiorum (strain ATCC 18683 / 1980 / Ss-1) TaxID=665079 RepID=A7EL79_SCLS1|nr:predicted protein [Sclerotinia sclerotiorum 1980 UF-70]EDO03595.1 predicted protein [Sclerotinia sclerotiorum 1980 UF-70]
MAVDVYMEVLINLFMCDGFEVLLRLPEIP